MLYSRVTGACRIGITMGVLYLLAAPLPVAAATTQVSTAGARLAAARFVARNPLFREAAVEFRVAAVRPLGLTTDTAATLYRVDLAPRGYVIVSADRRLPPVIGFSATAALELDTVPGLPPAAPAPARALRSLLEAEGDACRAALARSAAPRRAEAGSVPLYEQAWHALADAPAEGEPALDDGGAETVGPLLGTSWSQWRHFNKAYPADPEPGTGYDGKAPVGCVPLIGACLGHFYTWPPYGREGDVHLDTNGENLIDGSFSGIFADPYAWADMQAAYDPWSEEPAAAVDAVSEIIYEMGVAVGVDYGSFSWGGTSASMKDLAAVLHSRFYFEPGTLLKRSDDVATFDAAVKSEILAGRPVPASLPAHAVIVDGYMEDLGSEYYHINYGWAGVNDGWYLLSNVNSNSMRNAILGILPRAVPMPDRTGDGTNRTGTITLSWGFPQCRTQEVARFRVREGVFESADVADACGSFALWNTVGDWRIEPFDGTGTCFRLPGALGESWLTFHDAVRPSAGARMRFAYRAILLDDVARFKVSTDGGCTWDILAEITNTGWNRDTHIADFDLSPYAGRATMIRVEYVFEGGSYYADNGGLWIDNVEIEGSEVVAWRELDGDLSPAARGADVAPRLDGEYFYALVAESPTETLGVSPTLPVTVALDPALDLDADGLPNGWETAHFGSATGGVATADSDADGSSNAAEYAAGTDPRDDASRFAMAAVAAAPEGFRLSWLSATGRTYTVQRATGLTPGTDVFLSVTSGLPATPPTNIFFDAGAPPAPAVFYRIQVEPAP